MRTAVRVMFHESTVVVVVAATHLCKFMIFVCLVRAVLYTICVRTQYNVYSNVLYARFTLFSLVHIL